MLCSKCLLKKIKTNKREHKPIQLPWSSPVSPLSSFISEFVPMRLVTFLMFSPFSHRKRTVISVLYLHLFFIFINAFRPRKTYCDYFFDLLLHFHLWENFLFRELKPTSKGVNITHQLQLGSKWQIIVLMSRISFLSRAEWNVKQEPQIHFCLMSTGSLNKGEIWQLHVMNSGNPHSKCTTSVPYSSVKLPRAQLLFPKGVFLKIPPFLT